MALRRDVLPLGATDDLRLFFNVTPACLANCSRPGAADEQVALHALERSETVVPANRLVQYVYDDTQHDWIVLTTDHQGSEGDVVWISPSIIGVASYGALGHVPPVSYTHLTLPTILRV